MNDEAGRHARPATTSITTDSVTDQVIIAIALEGEADYFFGRPLDANPYSRRSARDGWESWRYGWLEGAWLNRARGDRERRRWHRAA